MSHLTAAMITDQKIDEIKRSLKRGTASGEIRADLEEEGYSKEEIEKCFQLKASDMRSWYLVFAVIFLIVGIVLFYKGGQLILVFSAAMFVQYYLADKKMKGSENV